MSILIPLLAEKYLDRISIQQSRGNLKPCWYQATAKRIHVQEATKFFHSYVQFYLTVWIGLWIFTTKTYFRKFYYRIVISAYCLSPGPWNTIQINQYSQFSHYYSLNYLHNIFIESDELNSLIMNLSINHPILKSSATSITQMNVRISHYINRTNL